jgi:hypothetical protein
MLKISPNSHWLRRGLVGLSTGTLLCSIVVVAYASDYSFTIVSGWYQGTGSAFNSHSACAFAMEDAAGSNGIALDLAHGELLCSQLGGTIAPVKYTRYSATGSTTGSVLEQYAKVPDVCGNNCREVPYLIFWTQFTCDVYAMKDEYCIVDSGSSSSSSSASSQSSSEESSSLSSSEESSESSSEESSESSSEESSDSSSEESSQSSSEESSESSSSESSAA